MPTKGAFLQRRRLQATTSTTNDGQRPRTSPGYQQTVKYAVNNDEEAVAEDEDEEEQIELLEYEWPDLPPIASMKDAFSRKRVSQGISYLLPVDKGRNSINNRFRTDLRAMFQEPYASDNMEYDDNRVKLSAKVHFLSNTADTKWTPQHMRSIPTQLNADCESARKLYVHSAPSGGTASRRMGIDPTKLRKRSNLFLPVKANKAQVSEEIQKIREEASEIIKRGRTDSNMEGEDTFASGKKSKNNNAAHSFFAFTTTQHQADDDNGNNSTDDFLDEGYSRQHPQQQHHHNHHHAACKDTGGLNPDGMLYTYGGSALNDSLGANTLHAKLQNVRINEHKFSTYDELRNAPPPKSQIPLEIRSPFLSPEDNQKIWEWLHYGESLSEFDYFLSVCG